MFDTLIRGGAVVDGTGRPAFAADVAVSGGRIAAIGDLSAASAAHVIDAAGRTVTPGFIDIHRHADAALFRPGFGAAELCQGLTTIVNGNCGLSAAPFGPAHGDAIRDYLRPITGALPPELVTETLSGYFASVPNIPVHVGMLAGAGVLRADAAGYELEHLEDRHYRALHRALEQALADGALGLNEGEAARMVRTPWFDYDIPFEQAAELGTRKVIKDHAAVGVVMTTDGTVTELPREAYEAAEERVVRELKELGKPFIVVLNTLNPEGAQARSLKNALSEKYDVAVEAVNVEQMRLSEVGGLMESLLFEFPLTELRMDVPAWLGALDEDHYLVTGVMEQVRRAAAQMSRVRDYEKLVAAAKEADAVEDVRVTAVKLNEGAVELKAELKDGLFFRVLGEASGQNVEGEEHLLKLMKELVDARREYDRVKDALQSVRETGYGLVPPEMDELTLEEPQLVKQGSRFGVRLKAGAPSLHMIRVDIQTEVSPIVGTEKQSEELVKSLLSNFEGDPKSLWETEIFGRSLSELVKEGLAGKLMRMPDDVRSKVQQSLAKIINEGNGGMICILL